MMTDQKEHPKGTKSALSTLLNSRNNSKSVNADTPMKEYLPTPVTPASEFPQFQSPNTSSFSTFSVIKPPNTPNQNNTRNSQPAVPTEAKPYPCPECHQTFSRPHNLKSHLTTHSSERPFQCDVCNHHFRRHHDLKRHQKLHTGERPYVCKDCFRSFARLDALNRHRRAEGGTACSAVHLVKQEIENVSSNSNATYHTNNKSTSSNTIADTTSSIPTASPPSATLSIPASTAPVSRPVIPQLHIPHPASHLYPRDSQPPTTAAPSSATIPPTHSPSPLSGQPPPPPPPPSHLLPSPSALSTLPITNNNNLTPIAYQHKSLPTTPSSPPSIQQNKSPVYHPHAFQPWSPYRSTNTLHTESTSPIPSRPTLPPLGSPPAEIGSKLERLQQENEELKRDIDQLRAMAQKEAAALKSRVHDLEIENKVLRSLIQNPVQTASTIPTIPANTLPAIGHNEDYLKRKRKNSTSPESHTSHDSNDDCGRKSPCLHK